VYSACVAAVICIPVLHHCVVIFFCSVRIMDWMLFTFFFFYWLTSSIKSRLLFFLCKLWLLRTFSQIKTTRCVLSLCQIIWPNICINITNQLRAMFICFYKQTYLEFSKWLIVCMSAILTVQWKCLDSPLDDLSVFCLIHIVHTTIVQRYSLNLCTVFASLTLFPSTG